MAECEDEFYAHCTAGFATRQRTSFYNNRAVLLKALRWAL